MKKRTKTTDSILRDIFDPLMREEEKSAHPLPSFVRAQTEDPAPIPENRIEAWVQEEIEPQPLIIETPTAPEEKKIPQDSHRFVVAFALFVFVGLSFLLGYFLYAQNYQIQQKRTLVKTAATSRVSVSGPSQPDPVLLRLNTIAHQGITFGKYSVKNKKLFLTGSVSNQALLVKFLNLMNQSAYFKNAKISSIEEIKTGSWRKLFNFRFYADVTI